MTDVSTPDQPPPAKRTSGWGRLVWLSIILLIIGDVLWLGWPTIQQWRQAWLERREAVHLARMVERQLALEQLLRKQQLPVFGPWEQVAPFADTLTLPSEPELKPASHTEYRLWNGHTGSWESKPQYVDGYPHSLEVKGIAPEWMSRRPTVCLARTITATQPTTIPVYLGSDGGFVLWLNGHSILISDTRDEFHPGQEVAQLELKPGENRLVLKIQLQQTPCRFSFIPDFGAAITDQLLGDLERKFPMPVRRATGYREWARSNATVSEEPYYRLVEIPVPKDIALEGGGLQFLPDRRLAVSTRRGFVYLVDGATHDDPTQAKFSQFASGLHEALGLHSNSAGDLVVAQRGSLTKLRDRDGDGAADTFQNLSSAWGLSGSYHEYTLDLEQDADGNYYTSLSLGDLGGGTNSSTVPYRGWIVQVTPGGTMAPWCFGFRSVDGLGWNAQGDLFATDNQGQWVAASPVYHVQRDHFYGSPPSKAWVADSGSEEAHRRVELPPTPPAVWIPYDEFCMSATDIVCDSTNGQFGPFGEQLFVGDMMKGTIVRVALEKIGGEYQGACFLFRRGVGAVHRMTFGPDHRLYLTRAARGWGGGGQGEGLARLEFTGAVPFEMASIHLVPDGFDIQFTEPLAEGAERFLDKTRIEQFRYHYWERYGSPKVDATVMTMQRCSISADRRAVSMKVDGLRRGHVCHLALPRVRSASQQVLLHTDAYYTVNRLASDSSVAIQEN